jgi:hypothetical protein
VKDCIQATPSEQQADGLIKFPKTKRMSIRSGHGTGKDAFASWIILWFLITRPYAKVVCTAPTAHQLADVLWAELSKWTRQSILADEFVIQKDKIFHKSAQKEWWARAVSTSAKASKEDQAETLQGFHGYHLLIVIDEASGVPDPVFLPLEGAMTQEDNRCLMIGNMNKNQGYFYDSQYHSEIKKAWSRLHWDSRKSSNVKQEMVDYFRQKYGEDSNVFRIRVMGECPLDSERTLIPLSWAQQCIGTDVLVAEDEPLYLGVDVARYGEDASIILPRKGLRIFPWEDFRGMNTINFGGFIKQTFHEQEAQGIGIDEIGVGAGVCDWLQKHDFGNHVFGVNVSSASSDIMKYHRLRDELWCRVRDKCQAGVYSFPDTTVKIAGADIHLGEELCNELAQPTYEFDNNGAYVIESKKKMKERGLASPNIADALCITEYFDTIAGRIWNHKDKVAKKKRRRQAQRNLGQHAWMVS